MSKKKIKQTSEQEKAQYEVRRAIQKTMQSYRKYWVRRWGLQCVGIGLLVGTPMGAVMALYIKSLW